VIDVLLVLLVIFYHAAARNAGLDINLPAETKNKSRGAGRHNQIVLECLADRRIAITSRTSISSSNPPAEHLRAARRQDDVHRRRPSLMQGHRDVIDAAKGAGVERSASSRTA
jgi:biopolymer transport protein ExbD